jgi:hypothetical protein
MKTTLKLRSMLEVAAAITGRTLSHEVEDRLSRSFSPNDIVFGTEETQALLHAIAGVIQVAEQSTRKDWHADEETADLVFHLVTRMLPRSDSGAAAPSEVMVKAAIVGMLEFTNIDDAIKTKVTALIDAKV